MSAGLPDLQPDELAALQAEEIGPEPSVRTTVDRIETPVKTQDLPRKAGSTNTYSVNVLGANGGVSPAKRILSAQARRASARIISVGQNMLVAFSANSAQQASSMALWPANLVLQVTTETEVWVAAATGNTSVSVITEFWATGD